MTDEEFAAWLGRQIKSPDRPRTYDPRIDNLLDDYQALKALDPDNKVEILPPVKDMREEDMAIRITGTELTTPLVKFVEAMQNADIISIHPSYNGEDFVIVLTYKKVSPFA